MTDFAPFAWLADYVTYHVLALMPKTRLGEAVHFFIQDVTKILFMLTSIIYGMGIVRGTLSPEKVRDFLAKRSVFVARFFAVGLGAVTPFCSCSSVPLFIGFVKAGIPLGITLSFLIASPMINEVAVILLSTVIGVKLTVIYVLTGLLIALLGGWILERFRPEQWVESFVWDIQVGAGQADEKQTWAMRHEYAVSQVKEIVGRIWKFVFLGIGIGSLIHGYVPQETLANLTHGNPVLSVFTAVLMGIPLYSDAVGIIPIAEALLYKGVPLGTVLAFMMSVTALSLPEMIILRQVIQWRLILLFAGLLAISFIGVGLLFNLVLI